jgi:hypothetical protein
MEGDDHAGAGPSGNVGLVGGPPGQRVVTASSLKVTVCLPTYNRADYLSQALASVLGQTFQDFEVIVSDNCSADNTGEVVRAVTDPRVRYVRNETNIGLFRNMNQCLEMARGEYICILHDDDLYLPEFLERSVQMLDRYPSAGFVHSAAYEIDAAGARVSLSRHYAADCLRNGDDEFVRYLQGHNVWFPTAMVRRDLYRQVGGFEPSILCSDFLMWLQLAIRADVVYISTPLAGMRIHSGALSSSLTPQRWYQEFFDILEQGLRMADAQRPGLIRSRQAVMQAAVRAQGRRFFIAAIAAMTSRDTHGAAGYIAVLRELEGRGLARVYGLVARMLHNRPGFSLLAVTRHLRRSWKTLRLRGGEA